jgi:DNA replication protein DnaC
MRKVSDACRRYAENFSEASSNLLFQGGTGLGKTYLSACIARVAAARGFSVCYDTAASALENYELAKFGRDTEEGEAAAVRIKRMESCDLMILDDLGTEMPTPMGQSALYTLINNRLVNGKKTIISTNLSNEELGKRYTPQIASRIMGEFQRLPFVGEDIRRLKRGV